MMKLFVYGGSFDTSLQALDKSIDKDSCPVCPTCLERDSATSHTPVDVDRPTSDGSSPMGRFVISFAWLAAGSGFVFFLFGVMMVRRQSRATALRAQMVPQYDIELRDSGFRDRPTNGTNGHSEDSRIV